MTKMHLTARNCSLSDSTLDTLFLWLEQKRDKFEILEFNLYDNAWNDVWVINPDYETIAKVTEVYEKVTISID